MRRRCASSPYWTERRTGLWRRRCVIGLIRSISNSSKTAENKRRWNIFNDVPWEKLDPGKATDQVGDRVEIFCAEELYVTTVPKDSI